MSMSGKYSAKIIHIIVSVSALLSDSILCRHSRLCGNGECCEALSSWLSLRKPRPTDDIQSWRKQSCPEIKEGASPAGWGEKRFKDPRCQCGECRTPFHGDASRISSHASNICKIKYYSTLIRKEILPLVTIWMNLKNIKLNAINQIHKCDFIYM